MSFEIGQWYLMAQTRIYYLKNNYLTFRSKVKVQQRSLWYTTHHLMDMHPHTKYHWPIYNPPITYIKNSFEIQRTKKMCSILHKIYLKIYTMMYFLILLVLQKKFGSIYPSGFKEGLIVNIYRGQRIPSCSNTSHDHYNLQVLIELKNTSLV
jgi:hypothetical protein